MRDNEWIEVAYILDRNISKNEFRELFEAFERYLRSGSADDEITDSYYRGDDYIGHYSDALSAAINNNESFQVELPFRGFNPIWELGCAALIGPPRLGQ
jgi:hypothetical protein